MKPALLAEDDPASRAFLSEALQLLGWQCEAFETGTAAAQAAIARRFEVLLLDFNLPDGDGIQYLRMIRNLDSHASSDSPALALTADDDALLHARLRNNGFDAVATKPLSIEQLGQVLTGLGLNPASADRQEDSRISEAGHGDSGYRAGEVAAAWEDLPLWDDAAGLATVGNNPAILSSLRELMLRDLPGQRDQILADPHSHEARQHLHRLRAACGFCGAARLAAAVNALESALAQPSGSDGPEIRAAITALELCIRQTQAQAPD